MKRLLPAPVHSSLQLWLKGYTAGPRVGRVRFGSLRRLTPISRTFGFDRGLPIDRHYIERFLSAHAGDIRGDVLEIGDNAYTRRFGGERVTKSDVLHVSEGNPDATIVGDLTCADFIPSDSFDCVILTQTAAPHLRCASGTQDALPHSETGRGRTSHFSRHKPDQQRLLA